MDMKPDGTPNNKLLVQKMKELFKMNLWDMLGAPSIDKFGDKVVEQLMKIETIGTNNLI
jgi:hypothetical protein